MTNVFIQCSQTDQYMQSKLSQKLIGGWPNTFIILHNVYLFSEYHCYISETFLSTLPVRLLISAALMCMQNCHAVIVVGTEPGVEGCVPCCLGHWYLCLKQQEKTNCTVELHKMHHCTNHWWMTILNNMCHPLYRIFVAK